LHLGESIIVMTSIAFVTPMTIAVVSGDAINISETSVQIGTANGEWIEFASGRFPFSGGSYWWIVGRGSLNSGLEVGWVTTFPATMQSAAGCKGKTYRYKNTSAVVSVTVNTDGSDLILDTGATSLSLPPLGWVSLYSDGTQWLIVG
jgi:hypothetical protein